MRRTRAAAALVLAAAACTAQAMSIREMRTLEANEKDGKIYASYYLVGVMEGLKEASDTALRSGQKPPFCIEGRRFDPTMARSLYQTELSRHADNYEADMPVQMVVKAALESSFRCTH